MTILIRPYNRMSRGARSLRDVLDGRADLVKTTEIRGIYSVVINWGSTLPIYAPHRPIIYNLPSLVAVARDKLLTFSVWKRIIPSSIPVYYTEPPVASDKIIFARNHIRGRSGSGITVFRPGEPIPGGAPLYVEYIKKDIEYRVHVVDGAVISIQQKKRRSDFDRNPDQQLIRSHGNGWVFCPINIDEVREDVKELALIAVASLGLTFGACDVVISSEDDRPYVLECNTAPGLTSPTVLQAYKEAFNKLC